MSRMLHYGMPYGGTRFGGFSLVNDSRLATLLVIASSITSQARTIRFMVSSRHFSGSCLVLIGMFLCLFSDV
ncbi:hypothetical protein BDV38DRAFT_140509 [Aspergillus pseudotamarii]|uniref:Uncharacterized protein n=1 Tax=Aspergillus pseudotamarii TaxID=132259 RepID=A0A5N6SN66_ASPPS|nr:uncharacterized protein BDV38DRAFT_140509 [Aspergillus pseudotamarii]KAE8135309.1 hypothetical protein BDV38DRAFT_140509 [Aspergillus pseudotamarii]